MRGPSWALRRAAAYGLIELDKLVPASALDRAPQHRERMGRLASMLHERRWRDKEGDAAKAIEAMGAPFAPPPGSRPAFVDPEEEPTAAAKPVVDAGGIDAEADSGDF